MDELEQEQLSAQQMQQQQEQMEEDMLQQQQMMMQEQQLQMQQMQQQYGNAQENNQKHYFDSIETDEFVMPTNFEVEIRMQDNQVSDYFDNIVQIKRVTVEV